MRFTRVKYGDGAMCDSLTNVRSGAAGRIGRARQGTQRKGLPAVLKYDPVLGVDAQGRGRALIVRTHEGHQHPANTEAAAVVGHRSHGQGCEADGGDAVEQQRDLRPANSQAATPNTATTIEKTKIRRTKRILRKRRESPYHSAKPTFSFPRPPRR